MTYKTILLTLLCPFFAPIYAQQGWEQYEKKHFQVNLDTTIAYRILYPKAFDTTKRYPIVIVLHGAGERGMDNEAQLTHGANLFLQPQNRDSFPCIVVFPQCPKHDYWSTAHIDRTVKPHVFEFDYCRPTSNALTSVAALIKSLRKTAYVDPNRIYLTGLSMGGMGTFELAAKYPTWFAAAIPICGGGDIKRLPKRIRRIPFWVFHGAADNIVGVKESQRMCRALLSLRATVKYTEYPTVAHDSWTNAFAEPDFMKWLFAQKRH